MNSLFSPKGKYNRRLLLPAGGLTTVLVAAIMWAEWEAHRAVCLAGALGWYNVAEASLLVLLSVAALLIWDWWRATHEIPQLAAEAAAYNRAIKKLTRYLAVGFVALTISATRGQHWVDGVVAQAIGYGTLIAGAFFISGVLLGFLFGFRPTSQSLTDQPTTGRSHPFTNLEEIADWLTKLLLGAGLVELTHLRPPLRQLVYFIAKGVEPQNSTIPGNPAIALAIIGFFFTSGVLYGYLWTRYELSLAAEMSGDDASALALVDRWLNQPTVSDDRTRSDLVDAIKGARLPTQMRIFLQTEQYRKPSTEDLNARSLPVFQALVEADPHEIFHRNRSQYAFALMGRQKDPNAPDADWNAAHNLLNEAIRIRDNSGEMGWQEYELARAVCRIHLDTNFKSGRPSEADARVSILADLDKAKAIQQAALVAIDKANVIAEWKPQNSGA